MTFCLWCDRNKHGSVIHYDGLSLFVDYICWRHRLLRWFLRKQYGKQCRGNYE